MYATCSLVSIYTGISGLEELAVIDKKFAEYENSLFDKSAQTWDRNLQTKEINNKLDEILSRLLIGLSPYVQLRACHKVLEWLIYR